QATIALGNITTGDGGRVVINPSGDNSDGRVTMASATNVVNVGPTGTVQIDTLVLDTGTTNAKNSVGTAALPVAFAGGNVAITATRGNVFVTGANAMTVTSAVITTNGSVQFSTTAGALTVAAPVSTPSGTVTLSGAGGVVLNAVVGSSTTGAISITG